MNRSNLWGIQKVFSTTKYYLTLKQNGNLLQTGGKTYVITGQTHISTVNGMNPKCLCLLSIALNLDDLLHVL